MKTTKSISLSWLLLAMVAGRACAGGTPTIPSATNLPVHLPQAEGFRTDINPALLYYRSFLLAPQPMSASDSDYLASSRGQSRNLPPRFGPIVGEYDNQFRLIRQAAHSTVPCDWGIDPSAGLYTLLPYLARVKAATIASQLRVAWELQDARQDDAREDLTAVFVMARNASRDGTMIGTLVQDACEGMVYDTIARNFGQFAPDNLRQLEDGLEAAPARGLLAANVPGEKTYLHDWLINKIRALQRDNPNDDAKVLAAIRPDYELIQTFRFFGEKQDGNLWQLILQASGGTSDGVLKLLEEMTPLYSRADQIMSLPEKDFESQAQQFKSEVQDSPNPLMPALLFFPSLRVREFEAEAGEAMVQAAIQYKLHGQPGLDSVRDPFGDGPFQFQRFVFQGVDRGFELRSAYAGLGYPCVLIFVERTGPPFFTNGPHAGQPPATP